MEMNRHYVCLKKDMKTDDSLVRASPAECLSFMWELTAEIWSLKGGQDVERRLQRNIGKLIKKRS